MIAFIHLQLLIFCQNFAFFSQKIDLFTSPYSRRCESAKIETTLDEGIACGRSCVEDHRDERTLFVVVIIIVIIIQSHYGGVMPTDPQHLA